MFFCTDHASLIHIHADTGAMKEENTVAHTANSTQIQLPDREWSGEIGRATSQGALFSLYLSIHCQPGAQTLKFEETRDPAPVDASFPERLNHYKRAPLKATDSDYTNLAITSRMANAGQHAALSLWQAMHPDPLSAHDDAMLISPEVRQNCSLATQLRLKQHRYEVKTVDETLLDDVIEGSQRLLTA